MEKYKIKQISKGLGEGLDILLDSYHDNQKLLLSIVERLELLEKEIDKIGKALY